MAERSGFFDAHLVNGEYDRVYLAENFARYFASFIGNGVFGGKLNELMVQQKTSADMSISVLAGLGFINGYWYENDDELSLAIDNADGVLNRIDLVVLRWDKSERVVRLAIEKGTAASSPSVPTLKRNSDHYELMLAKVFVRAGATRITQADITDMRLDSSVCGLVTGLITQIDTTDFNTQLVSFIEEFIAELDAIAADNDLVDLTRRVEDLEAGGGGTLIESEEHPGCYYAKANDIVEWLNPPNEAGIEYRLLERFEEKPVYQMFVPGAALPNNSYAAIILNIVYTKIVSVQGVARYGNTLSGKDEIYPFPVLSSTSVTPIAAIQNVGTEFSPGSGVGGTYIGVRTTQNMSSYTAEFVIKYTKS